MGCDFQWLFGREAASAWLALRGALFRERFLQYALEGLFRCGSLREQGVFLVAREALEAIFRAHRVVFGGEFRACEQGERPAPARVLRACACAMLGEARRNIGRVAGVERAVAAFEDVEVVALGIACRRARGDWEASAGATFAGVPSGSGLGLGLGPTLVLSGLSAPPPGSVISFPSSLASSGRSFASVASIVFFFSSHSHTT